MVLSRRDFHLGLQDAIRPNDADVICFQEYYYTTGTHFDTRDTLLKLLDSKHYFEHFTTKVKESNKNDDKIENEIIARAIKNGTIAKG